MNPTRSAGSLATMVLVGFSLLSAGCAGTAGPPVGAARAKTGAGFGEFSQYPNAGAAGAQCGQGAGLQGSNGYHR